MLAVVATPNLAFRTIKSISWARWNAVVRRLAPRDDLHYLDAGALHRFRYLAWSAAENTERRVRARALEINVCGYY